MKICQNCSSEIQDTFNFCPNCGSDLGKPIECSNCKYPNEPNSKFCQECGEALFEKYRKSKKTEKKIEIEEIPLPTSGITIEFPYTTAQSFEFAVAEAKKFETFEKFGDEKKAIYRVTIAHDELYKAKELLQQLKGWRKRTVYLNGEKVLWESVFDFVWCYERKLASYKPEFYCFGYENQWDFNLWGCTQARMTFTEYSNWFTYGKWINNNGDWQFDKERIKHELAKNLHSYRFCPAFNPDFIQEVLDAIPDVVNPSKNKNWKYIRTYTEENNCLAVKSNEYGYEQTVFYKGVCPNGKSFLNDISESIKKRLPDFIKED